MTRSLDNALAACKALVFGSASLSQQCPIGLRDPQSEVSVWLHGLGVPRDVTYSHVMACAVPLTLGVGLQDKFDPPLLQRSRISLEFRERAGGQKLLGRIGLRWKETVPLGAEQLLLFGTSDCGNYCLSRFRLRARYAYHTFKDWRARKRSLSSQIPIGGKELQSVFVFYICPRPVVLVTARDGEAVNIFPMDLIGSVGTEHFTLALHDTSTAVPLLERSRQIALSSVPVEQLSLAYELGQNHRISSVELDHLPFATLPSPAFGLPVPCFSLRVREMQIEAVRSLGSHKLFIARTIEDQQWAKGPQLFFVHGIYYARRLRYLAEYGSWDTHSFARQTPS